MKPATDDGIDKFRCTRCGAIHKKQRGNFPISHSPLFKMNGGFLPICNKCLDELFDHYREALGDGQEAVRRLCMKFDIYWSPEIYAITYKSSTSVSRIRSYIAKTNLIKYIEKTYDDTLDEEVTRTTVEDARQMEDEYGVDPSVMNRPMAAPGEVKLPSKETILFWGSGFKPEFYHELELRYDRWTKGLKKPIDRATEALYKQICIAEATVNKNIMMGKNIESSQEMLNKLLGSLNLKPNQKEDASGIDQTPMGVWIRRWEEKRPVPQDDPELKDEHGIIKYISVWMYGHLCKTLGIKNAYSKLYEDEIAKYRVQKPEFNGEDDEDVFNAVFGGDDGGDDT